MKTLLILRHAKSSWSNMNLSDHDRPLNKRGKRDAPRMGVLLKENDLMPDLIISSTAERAMSTAELVALACDYEREIVLTRDFYHASPDAYLEKLVGVSDEQGIVMVVGHNPGMEELVMVLSSRPEFMSTANIAHIQLPINSWRELNEGTSGKLVNLWRPKEI